MSDASSIQTATPAREIVYVLERFIDYEGSDILGLKSKCRACGEDTRGNYDMLCRACWKAVPQSAKDSYLKVWRLAVLYDRRTIQELEQAEAELIASIITTGA